MKKRIEIEIEQDILAIIDELSKIIKYSRDKIIEFSIRRMLRDLELYHKRMDRQRKRLYDIIDRVIEEVIKKYWVEKHDKQTHNAKLS